MFRAEYRSSSGALTVFAATGLHAHVVPGRIQVCYKVASCWLFLLSHTTMHGSMNIKRSNIFKKQTIVYLTKNLLLNSRKQIKLK